MKRISVEDLLEHLEERDALATVSFRDDEDRSYCGVRFDRAIEIIDADGEAYVVAHGHTVLLPYDSGQDRWTGKVEIVKNDQISEKGYYDPRRPEEYIPRTHGAIRGCLSDDFPEIPLSSGTPPHKTIDYKS